MQNLNSTNQQDVTAEFDDGFSEAGTDVSGVSHDVSADSMESEGAGSRSNVDDVDARLSKGSSGVKTNKSIAPKIIAFALGIFVVILVVVIGSKLVMKFNGKGNVEAQTTERETVPNETAQANEVTTNPLTGEVQSVGPVKQKNAGESNSGAINPSVSSSSSEYPVVSNSNNQSSTNGAPNNVNNVPKVAPLDAGGDSVVMPFNVTAKASVVSDLQGASSASASDPAILASINSMGAKIDAIQERMGSVEEKVAALSASKKAVDPTRAPVVARSTVKHKASKVASNRGKIKTPAKDNKATATESSDESTLDANVNNAVKSMQLKGVYPTVGEDAQAWLLDRETGIMYIVSRGGSVKNMVVQSISVDKVVTNRGVIQQ